MRYRPELQSALHDIDTCLSNLKRSSASSAERTRLLFVATEIDTWYLYTCRRCRVFLGIRANPGAKGHPFFSIYFPLRFCFIAIYDLGCIVHNTFTIAHICFPFSLSLRCSFVYIFSYLVNEQRAFYRYAAFLV